MRYKLPGDRSTIAGRVEDALSSSAGQAGFKIYTIAFGLVVTVLLTIATSYLGQLNQRMITATQHNVQEDQTQIKQQAQIDYTGHRVDVLERSSDATIQALQVMTNQITHNSDRIDTNEYRQKGK